MRKGRRGWSGSEVPPVPAARSGAERPAVLWWPVARPVRGALVQPRLGKGAAAAPERGTLGACQCAAEPAGLWPLRGSGRGGASGARQDGGSVSVVGTGGSGLWRVALRASPGRQVVGGRGSASPVGASAGRRETRGYLVTPFLLPSKGEGLPAKGRTVAAAPRAVLRPQGLRWRAGGGTGGVKSVSALGDTEPELKGEDGKPCSRLSGRIFPGRMFMFPELKPLKLGYFSVCLWRLIVWGFLRPWRKILPLWLTGSFTSTVLQCFRRQPLQGRV